MRPRRRGRSLRDTRRKVAEKIEREEQRELMEGEEVEWMGKGSSGK